MYDSWPMTEDEIHALFAKPDGAMVHDGEMEPNDDGPSLCGSTEPGEYTTDRTRVTCGHCACALTD